MTDIMDHVEQHFEQQHPDVDVRVNLAGTNNLVRQLNSGAEADLFLAADISAVDQLLDRPVDGPVVLAVNNLTMIVPKANEAGIDDPQDVADPRVLTARCAAGVPCGNATDRFLERAGFTIGRSTDEHNVRSVLAKVSADEVDAGFVYRSDLNAASDVTEIPLPRPPQVTVGLVRLGNGDAAIELMALLESDEIADLFADLGFEPVGGTMEPVGGTTEPDDR
ncbi:MAG: molybdate ABC transporter substrate-binding protein [Acidimicrobiia bacterium]|nr:molybdate ABC transporter substrate-binding protein [Acidimicrobiia bacterium]